MIHWHESLKPHIGDVKTGTTRETRVRRPPSRQGTTQRRACLLVLTEPLIGRSFELSPGVNRVGRSPEMSVALVDDEFVSRHHADVTYGDDGARLQDRGSRNGTWVNGEPVEQRRLQDGDRIQVGSTVLKFLEADDLEAAYMDAMYRLATHDGLTNLYTKRHFLAQLERLVEGLRRDASWLGVFMMDVDLFKKINDTYGHLAGDRVLQELARGLLTTIRKRDLLARYGGEEFGLLAPHLPRERALQVGERLRQVAGSTEVPHEGQTLQVSISVGVWVGTIGPQSTAEDILKEADQALYAAKAAGRNRVVLRPAQASLEAAEGTSTA